MGNGAAYMEHLAVNRWGLGGLPDYGEWQASRKYHAHTGPFGARYANNEDDTGEIVLYTDGRIGRLRKRYEFRGGTEVENFLEEHDYLIGPLSDAYDRIRDYFGPRARLALKVIRDPEARQDEELFVFIQTGLSARAARTLLAEFDRNWWQHAFPETQGRLTIGLEYI
jgi:hypothetical protein